MINVSEVLALILQWCVDKADPGAWNANNVQQLNVKQELLMDA